MVTQQLVNERGRAAPERMHRIADDGQGKQIATAIMTAISSRRAFMRDPTGVRGGWPAWSWPDAGPV